MESYLSSLTGVTDSTCPTIEEIPHFLLCRRYGHVLEYQNISFFKFRTLITLSLFSKNFSFGTKLYNSSKLFRLQIKSVRQFLKNLFYLKNSCQNETGYQNLFFKKTLVTISNVQYKSLTCFDSNHFCQQAVLVTLSS